MICSGSSAFELHVGKLTDNIFPTCAHSKREIMEWKIILFVVLGASKYTSAASARVATWGPWSRFTPCSVTCGGGTKMRTRDCEVKLVYGRRAPCLKASYCAGAYLESPPCNTHECPKENTPSVRYGSVIKLPPENYQKYKELHANVWPEVLDRLSKSNIRNYVIYYSNETSLLFSHFEYIGTNYAADMKAIADDPKTLEWWRINCPLQESFTWTDSKQLYEGGTGNWWAPMQEVFHDGHSAVKFL
ncbi:uncharacterized protein LOC106167890 isoform X1 [Lingula anatina]|uniref:Uncharacterized protein LOC106167890 isoform X1 n=1 Tax=Lingula anatina TaxID=7574 RepID=A0A1S3IVL7_LINAN|nr:uncharacterized protein LOC106167890 isoform X1 [Lingula anatina]|eukprot:XP_013402237.1 uncharacterized protein LOC106167890 isoform X1 [Lingula anatina]